MTCCSEKNAITIVRGNDTNFNGQVFLTLNLTTNVLNLSTFSASFSLGGITKKFNDLSSGTLLVNYNAKETQSLPFGLSYGVLRLFDNSGRVATIESKIPFCVIGQVSGNAIATQPFTLNFDVKQGGENILNVSVEAGVTVEVGETTTLPPGSSATVTNSGTENHLVLNFGIPEGEKGDKGDTGPAGKDATINGKNAIALVAGTGIDVTDDNGTVIISNTQTSAEWGNIEGDINQQYDLMQKLAQKQNTISDLDSIRSGASKGATALQPTDVINNTSSTVTNKPLSAAMGKSLQDQVDNLSARGRFLALWNCATGLAQSNPPQSSYLYKSGDYFIVGTVAASGGTNYRPDGTQYVIGVASTVVETLDVDVDDVYYYDGEHWRLQVNTQKTVSFVNIAGDPYDNTALASALNAKQDELVEGTGIAIDSDTNTISNSGVRSVSSGSTNGTISVNTNGTSAEVSVAGLGTAAFTSSTDYATAAQGTLADTAVQPADLSDYVTTNTAQDITATKTFKAQQRIQSGQADGCLIVGADVAATTLTNGTRKLGRMGFPTNEDITLNCAFVSCDTQGAASSSGIENSVDFGGRVGDTTSTSPDALTFTVAKEHNTTSTTKKLSVLRMDKNAANFTVEPKYNGSPLVTTDTQQTIINKKTVATSSWNGGLTLKRTTTGSSFVVFENSDNVLGGVGLSPSSVPISTDRTNQNAWAIVRSGAWNNPAVGNSTTPVYIDSNGMAQPCSQSIGPSVVTLANNSTVTIASNTMYKAGTLTSFGITLPTGSYPFVCEFDFKSGSTATTITYTGTIKWVDGSDDIINDVFVPVTNKSYTVVIWWNNNAWVGSAKGV